MEAGSVPGRFPFTSPEEWATRHEERLRLGHEPVWRHEETIDGDIDEETAIRVERTLKEQVDRNLRATFDAVRGLEVSMNEGRLDLEAVDAGEPGVATTEELTAFLRGVVDHKLGGETDVEVVHPQKQTIRYQLKKEDQNSRLSVAFAEPQREETEAGIRVTKHAMVFDQDEGRFLDQSFVRVESAPTDEPAPQNVDLVKGGQTPDISLVSTIDILSKSHAVKPAE